MTNNISYITVKIEHRGDIEDIVADCDYGFNHNDIIDTEIVDSDVFKEKSETVVVCYKCKKDPTVRQTLSHWSEKNVEFLKSIYCQTCLDLYLMDIQ